MILGGSKISCSGWKRRMKKVVWREEWQGIEAMKCTRWTWLLYRTLWNNFQYVWKKIWYPHIGKQKSAILTPKVWYLRPKGNFLFWNTIFREKGISPIHAWGYPEKNSVSEVGVIFQGLGQRNLVGPSGPPKKWPTLTTDLVPAEFTEKQAFFVLPKSRKWAKHPFSPPKNHLNSAKRLIY